MRMGLEDNLKIDGYHVVSVATMREGRNAATTGHHDLIILDVMLPDGDGVELCRQLRAQGRTQPIIMLTAKGAELDKVLALEIGADDYVVKPFGLRELLARIRAHLRRTRPRESLTGAIKVGAATIDFKRHCLTRDGQPLEISAKEVQLLEFLVTHRGDVISRESLLAAVWGHESDEIVTRTIDNFIVRLRKKIERDPARPRVLITVHGRGYKLIEE